MSRRYKQVYDGDWVMPRRRGYKLMCCDCGLVHRINFRLEKKPSGRVYLFFQAFRDKTATALSRRHRKDARRPRK